MHVVGYCMEQVTILLTWCPKLSNSLGHQVDLVVTLSWSFHHRHSSFNCHPIFVMQLSSICRHTAIVMPSWSFYRHHFSFVI